MKLDAYLELSKGWLIDHTSVYDLARSTERAMQHDYVVPKNPTWDDGPCLGSWNGTERIQAAVPLSIKTSLEAGKAAELAMGSNYAGHPTGKIPISFLDGSSPRVGAVIARAGIVVQFELWKDYARLVSYPFNKKQMKGWTFLDKREEPNLEYAINRRNELTHEPMPANDPNMRELVEFCSKLHWLAKMAASYMANKSSN
ncbi:hypothetical protein [Acidithiobacillus thiooxidans]|uniref:RiboL-PSP-HEPN domain-containing protein n=1 Tax=Acidithiobacillus thiooxidans ATCC 19377 TaxID=637390 RepID=A0A543Q1H2_ACITH|nr:hypothetical protein [Acidithiobacillus thiooxidans]MDX5935883.1 hypothetical protein [Acidithiobacillus thiooxidans]TQN50182.1 hypothetical protein DLNHIDIE_00019 [Acidithiobacillus thiooxidans ATCC 19377]